MSRGPQRIPQTAPLPVVIATNLSQAVPVNITGCKRCGDNHPSLLFHAIFNPSDVFNWWATCPTTGQPLLIKITEPEQI